jgi:hypothetical protein
LQHKPAKKSIHNKTFRKCFYANLGNKFYTMKIAEGKDDSNMLV